VTFLRKPFRYNYNGFVFVLICINLIAYLFSMFISGANIVFGLNFYGLLARKWWWQPLTYMFMHGNASHLLFNMLGLGFFGIMVERAIGSSEFLLFYIVCGILSGLLAMVCYFFTGLYGVTLIGASGAIYATLLLYATIFPTAQVFVFYIIPVPAPLLVVLFSIGALGSQIIGYKAGISHIAHLCGFLVAFLYINIRMGINPIRVWREVYRR